MENSRSINDSNRTTLCALVLFLFWLPFCAQAAHQDPPSTPLPQEERAAFLKQYQFFENVEAQLLQEFIGFDDVIRRMMSAVRAITFAPANSTPTVIPMISFPGYGKTSLVQRSAQLLGLNHRFRQVDIKQGSVELPTADVRQLAEPQTDSLVTTPSIVLLDEIGNLKKEASITKEDTWDPVNNRYSAFAESRARDLSLQFWWQVLGNGVAQMEPNPGTAVPPSPKQCLTNLTTILALRAQNPNTDIQNELRNFYNNWPLAFYGLEMSFSELLSKCQTDCTEILAAIRDNIRKYRLQVETYHHLIVFIAGNPDSIMDDINFRFAGHEVSPDQMHDAAESITNTNIVAWFRETFGYRSGWESRLRLSQWTFMLPFSTQQWKEAVQSLLYRFESKYRERMMEFGISGNLKFDESVAKMLEENFIDSKNGPRTLYSMANVILGDIVTKSAGAVVSTSDIETTEHNLIVRYDGETDAFVLNEIAGSKSIQLVKLRIPFNSSIGKLSQGRSQALIDERRSLMALHQAAYATAGMVFFGSVPRSLSLNISPGDKSIYRIWDSPAIQDHWYERTHLEMVIAAMASLTAYRATTFVAGIQEKELALAHEILRSIGEDLQSRGRSLSFLKLADNASAPIEEILPMGIFNDHTYEALNRGETEKALKAVYRSVQALMARNEGLIGHLKAALLKSPSGEIDGNYIKEIVAQHMNSSHQSEIKQLILQSQPGRIQLAEHPLNGQIPKPPFLRRFYNLMIGFFAKDKTLPNRPSEFVPTRYSACIRALSPDLKAKTVNSKK